MLGFVFTQTEHESYRHYEKLCCFRQPLTLAFASSLGPARKNLADEIEMDKKP